MRIADLMQDKLVAAFAPQSVRIEDESHRHEGHAGHRPGGQTHFRVTIVAEAFRGKEIGDGFTLEKRPGRISLAPGLKPERVENIEGGVKYDRNGITASAVYYRTKIRDVVLDQLGAVRTPGTVQDAVYYENVGNFKAEGFELRAGYRTGPFSIEGYFNHYDSRLNDKRIEGYEQIALGNSVGDNWAVSAAFEPSSDLSLRATVTRYEDLNDIEVLFREKQLGFVNKTYFIDKPGYTVVDISGTGRPFGTDRIAPRKICDW